MVIFVVLAPIVGLLGKCSESVIELCLTLPHLIYIFLIGWEGGLVRMKYALRVDYD